MSREAMQMALEALVEINKLSIGENAICLPAEIDGAMDALRERLAQPVQEPVDSPEKAGAYMDARLWEFIDMAAAWPEAKTDTRTWDHVLVYAPKQLEQEPVAWITDGGNGELWWYRSSKFDEEGNVIGPNPDDIPLYTAPPKKQWVGLTEEEIEHIADSEWEEAFVRMIEAKLLEKNT